MRGYAVYMTNDAEQNQPSDSPGQDSTVTDWHGQEVDRDIEAADDALTLAGGDESAAEEIFDDIRPDHPSDKFKVPADDREGTLVSGTSDSDQSAAATHPGDRVLMHARRQRFRPCHQLKLPDPRSTPPEPSCNQSGRLSGSPDRRRGKSDHSRKRQRVALRPGPTVGRRDWTRKKMDLSEGLRAVETQIQTGDTSACRPLERRLGAISDSTTSRSRSVLLETTRPR